MKSGLSKIRIGNPKTSSSLAAAGLAIVGLAALTVSAGTSITGSLEAGYNYNLSIPSDSNKNVLHSYDGMSKTFTLNNAHLVFSGSDSATGLGYTVETDIGSDAKFNRSLDASLGAADIFDLQEGYITWAFGPGRTWTLKAGKYVTYQGIEVVEGGSNPTVTRGLLFGLAEPVSHTGLDISNTMGIFDVHAAVVNGCDLFIDNNTMPSLVGKVGINLGNPLALTISTMWGPEKAGNIDDKRFTLDATGVTKVIPMVDLWFQGLYGMEDKASLVTTGEDNSWMGFGLQPLVHLNNWFGLGLRYEFFSDVAGSRTSIPVKDLTLQNISLAPTIWLTNTTMVRGEFRMDFASKDIYLDGDAKAAGSQMEIAADFVTGF